MFFFKKNENLLKVKIRSLRGQVTLRWVCIPVRLMNTQDRKDAPSSVVGVHPSETQAHRTGRMLPVTMIAKLDTANYPPTGIANA